MKALKLTLSGKNAFFKKPEVNAYYYFTYGQIHKVALLGIFGAILGYNGYAQKKWTVPKKGQTLTEEYPEFYEKLRQLKVSIVPQNEKGYIPKKVQQFNNSVGYASAELGGNLIIKEQWLENPVWDIYVMLDCEAAQKLAEYMQDNRCVFLPYLGKNDHRADIADVQIVEMEVSECEDEQMACLFPKEDGMIGLPDEEEMDTFKYEEILPIGLNGYTNLYEYQKFCFTNFPVEINKGTVYKEGKRRLIFY